MVAHEIYAASLVSKGHGHPLWEPDPGESPPVMLADVGYISDGRFIKLFNVSRGVDDLNNIYGLPQGHMLLKIGRTEPSRTPLPAAPEYISSEGVSESGVGLDITAGYFAIL